MLGDEVSEGNTLVSRTNKISTGAGSSREDSLDDFSIELSSIERSVEKKVKKSKAVALYEKKVIKAMKLDAEQHPQTFLINKLTDISTQLIRQEHDVVSTGESRQGPRE